MVHPLDGARRRVTRARQHFDFVQAEWNAVPQEAKAITLRSDYEADLKKIVMRIDTIPSVNQDWALDISECLFNLRCALDYLAWELAKWNLTQQQETRDPKNTYFPIATSEKRFSHGQVEDLHPSHVAVIKWLQPYSPLHMAQYIGILVRHPESDAEGFAHGHVAVSLREANNADKHRFLGVTAVGPEITSTGEYTAHDCEIINMNFFVPVGAFEVDAKWVEFDVSQVTGPNPHVYMPVDVTPTLAFGDLNFLTQYPLMERWVNDVLDTFSEVLSPA